VPQTQAHGTKRVKKAKETDVSLEAHASTVPSDDVSISFYLFSSCILSFSDILFPSGFDEEIRRFGH
jgi:hypothetical protein